MTSGARRLWIISLLAAGAAMLLPAQATADYTFLRSFGGPGSGPAELNLPLGVSVDRDGIVYVADTFNHRVQRFDADGTYLGQIGAEGSGPGSFSSPFDVEIDGDGRLLVADTGNRRVQRLDPETGAVEAILGTPGSGPGRLAAPTGIAPLGDDVMVVDRDNTHIHRYGADGTLLEEWGVRGGEAGQLQTPLDLTVGEGGSVFVADAGNNRVQRFTAAGAFEGAFSDGLATPQGVDAGGDGTLFVADSGNDRVRLLDPFGGFLGGWGMSGSGQGEFDLPRGIAADCAGRVFVTDAFNNRVQVFVDPELDESRNSCELTLEDLIELAEELDLPGRSEHLVVLSLRKVERALDRGKMRTACRRLGVTAHLLGRFADVLERHHGRGRGQGRSDDPQMVERARDLAYEIDAFAERIGC